MNNSKLLSLGLDEAFDWLDQVVRGLTPEQYAWQPPGTANPISKLHAHTLSSGDFWLNVTGLGKPLLWTGVAEKLGLPANPMQIWKFDGPISIDDLQAYAAALRADGVANVEALDDASLLREIDSPFFGRRDVAFVIRLAATQLTIHTGEISATKGIQGLRGLPV